MNDMTQFEPGADDFAEDLLLTYVPEQALLAACLARNDVWSIAAERLKPEDFSDYFHARIFVRMGEINARAIQINPITLCAEMKGDRALGDGPDGQDKVRRYIVDLARSCAGCAPSMVKDWAGMIATAAAKRRIRDIATGAGSLDRPLSEIAAEMNAATAAAGDAAGNGRLGMRSLATAANAAQEQAQVAFKAGGQITGVASGLLDVDKIVGGFGKSDLAILGGRPSMGKSVWALNMAYNAAKAGHPTAFFSLEMSAEQMAMRIFAAITGIPTEAMRRGSLTEIDFAALRDAQQHLESIPLHIDDRPALTVHEIKTAAERLKAKGGLDLIVIDYLQLVRPDRKLESRTVDITDVSAGLKGIAKALDVPVLALAQLSRAVEQRDIKKPQLADLRDSGAIEQDADQVLFIYREEHYAQREEPDAESDKWSKWQARIDRCAGLAEIIIAKNRHGKTGEAKVKFDGARQKFENYYPGGDDHHG